MIDIPADMLRSLATAIRRPFGLLKSTLYVADAKCFSSSVADIAMTFSCGFSSLARLIIARSGPEAINEPDRWKPPSVEIGFRASWLGYTGGNGGGIGFILDSISPPGEQVVIALGNSMQNGWNLGASVTIDSQKYFSQEFSYNRSFSTFKMGLAVVDNDTTSATVQSACLLYTSRCV